MAVAARARAVEWRGIERGLRGAGARLWRFSRLNPAGAIGAAVVIALTLLAILAPIIRPYDPTEFVAVRYARPFENAADGGLLLFGSDHLGRDEFSRLLYGARVSLTVGFTAPLLGVAVGTLLGIVSAYFGRVVDLILQRFVDTLLVLPYLVIVITITVAFGFTMKVVIFAVALGSGINAVRIVRSHVLSVRGTLYVEAQRAIGSSSLRIILLHLVPNTLPVSIVLVTVGIAAAIVTEAQLSFLGLGIAPPTPSWGNMLSGAQDRFELGPHLAIWPGVMISITVLAMSLFGDAVRDVMDPRLRGRR